MKPLFNSSILRCALALLAATSCSLVAQAPAGGGAPAAGGTTSGGGRTTSTGAGAAANRTGTNAAADRNAPATNATGTNANAPGTNTTGANATGTATGTNATNSPANRTNSNPTLNGTNPNGANTGTPASGTNGTNTNTTGTNATGTNATATNPNGTVTGTSNSVGTNANGTRTAGAANTTGTANGTGTSATAGTTSLPAGTLTSSGTIGEFGTNEFALQGPTTSSPNATPYNFAFGADTLFLDSLGNSIPRERFFRRGSKVPATVYYSRQPNGNLVANRVVMNDTETSASTAASVESAGTITEVSPGILVIEQPGASDTRVRYVNNKTTNYVNENGEPVAPESVKAGTPVKIFYTKVGDTLVASKVEVHRSTGGLPKPEVPSEQSSTRPAKDLPR